MQIDWVTVIAQILNFLVLVWLLNRVLYRPVTRALEARRETVQRRLSEAEEARAEAEREAERLRRSREELEEAREARLSEMEEEVEAQRREMTEEARAQVERRREEWERQVERERESFLERLRERARGALRRVLARALEDLADEALEARVAGVFRRRLEALDEETRADLAEAARASEGPPRIRSAFPLGEEARDGLARAVTAIAGEDRAPDFATDEALACGVALEIGSRRIDWTVESYLDGLEAEIAEALDGASGAEPREAGSADADADADADDGAAGSAGAGRPAAAGGAC